MRSQGRISKEGLPRRVCEVRSLRGRGSENRGWFDEGGLRRVSEDLQGRSEEGL